MALRNAFGELALESTLRKILHALTLAKSPSDQLRVVVDTMPVVSTAGSSTLLWAGNSNATIASSALPPFNQNSWNAQDAREEAMIMTQNNFQNTRNRWTIS